MNEQTQLVLYPSADRQPMELDGGVCDMVSRSKAAHEPYVTDIPHKYIIMQQTTYCEMKSLHSTGALKILICVINESEL